MSNRTYQVIAGIRYLALNEKPTTLDNLAELFREQKATDRQRYAMAYISPSSLQEILIRLMSEEGLLDRENSEFHLTPKGSMLADVLGSLTVHPSSTDFLTNYKAHVVNAWLDTCYKAGQRPEIVTTVSSVAEAIGLSHDSARRGLNDLLLSGVVQKQGEKYELIKFPVVTPAAASSSVAPSPLDEVLNKVDETPKKPFDFAPPAQRNPVNAPPDALASDIDPHQEVAEVQRVIEQTKKEAVAEAVKAAKAEEATPAPPPPVVDPCKHVQWKWEGFAEWGKVDLDVQKRFLARATAMGMTVSDYLAALDQDLVEKAKAAFLPPPSDLPAGGCWFLLDVDDLNEPEEPEVSEEG